MLHVNRIFHRSENLYTVLERHLRKLDVFDKFSEICFLTKLLTEFPGHIQILKVTKGNVKDRKNNSFQRTRVICFVEYKQ